MDAFILWLALTMPWFGALLVNRNFVSCGDQIRCFSYGVICSSTGFCLALWRFFS